MGEINESNPPASAGQEQPQTTPGGNELNAKQAAQTNDASNVSRNDASKENAPHPERTVLPAHSEGSLNPQPTPPHEIYIKCCKNQDKAWKDKLEVAGFVLGLVGAGVFAIQLIMMREQLNEMKKSTGVTQGQLEEMQKARIQDERAWVTAYSIVSHTNTITNVWFTVTIKNTGKTPAINVTTWLDATNVPATNGDGMATIDTNGTAHYRLLAPDNYGLGTEAEQFNRERCWREINSGNTNYFVYGLISYDDIFNSNHWTRFCWRVGTELNYFGGTRIGNTCDDIKPNPNR